MDKATTTNEPALEPLIRKTALAAAAVLTAMLAIGFATGVAQEPLQWITGADGYARFLAAHPATFRLVVGLDNLFVAFYVAHFVLLRSWLRQKGAPAGLTTLAIAGMLTLAGLDLVENMDYLVLSRRVDAGLGAPEWLLHAQVLLSWLKFHIGYVALFALGLAYPRRTFAQRALAAALMWVQLPLGILIYLAPHQVAPLLVLARALFFLGGFLAIARIVGAAPAIATAREDHGADLDRARGHSRA
jgi:hypothetical protein